MQYKVLKVVAEKKLEDTLNEQSAAGWRLVQVVPSSQSGITLTYMVVLEHN